MSESKASKASKAAARGPALPKWRRRQVSAGDLGAAVRFEIETDRGSVLRYLGDEAEAHVRALDLACTLVGRSIAWPQALPEVRRKPARSAP